MEGHYYEPFCDTPKSIVTLINVIFCSEETIVEEEVEVENELEDEVEVFEFPSQIHKVKKNKKKKNKGKKGNKKKNKRVLSRIVEKSKSYN